MYKTNEIRIFKKKILRRNADLLLFGSLVMYKNTKEVWKGLTG